MVRALVFFLCLLYIIHPFPATQQRPFSSEPIAFALFCLFTCLLMMDDCYHKQLNLLALCFLSFVRFSFFFQESLMMTPHYTLFFYSAQTLPSTPFLVCVRLCMFVYVNVHNWAKIRHKAYCEES
ncbi:MAG: hypothetical protein J3R72DRAFT_443020 [Linnemannia gamsii]|nr:MAG: hypothetical protein J3R72DRAFT_443020 [Linnemannia gamsii]